MLTSFADDEALFEAIMAGASGYLLKQIKGADLVEAMRRVAAGQSLLDPAVTARVLERLRSGPEEDERLARLTDQERQDPASCIADGLTNRQIGERMLPRREDGEELRVEPAGEARHGAAAPRPRSTPPDWARSKGGRRRRDRLSRFSADAQ